MTNPKLWTIQTTTKSHCGHCMGYLDLLCEDYPAPGSPMFYICWTCKKVLQAGEGEVRREGA